MISAFDSLEVDRGDAEVAVAELALNHDEWHAFASHLDGAGVTQLVWSEPTADARGGGRAPQLSASGGGRPLATTRPAVEDTEHRADGKPARNSSHGWSSSHPHVSMPT